MLALILSSSVAAEPDVSEEVIVWARPFARFDDQRWLMKSEVVTPSVVPLGEADNPLRAHAWQLEVIVHCQLDGKGRLRETLCPVEAAALRVHVPDPRAGDERAIDALAASLIGARVQLQVNEKGKVPNLDFDGLREDNLADRRLSGGVRTLLSQLSAAFHMEVPQANPVGASWVSYQEPLLGIAAPKTGMSSVRAAHRIDAVDDLWIEQVSAKATSTTPVPNPNAGMPCFPAGACPRGAVEQPEFYPDREFIYATELDSVAVIDPAQGFPVERVWSVHGSPTAGSPGTLGSGDYWSAGFIRALEPNQTAELGTSGMVGPMGRVVPGQRLWVSVTRD